MNRITLARRTLRWAMTTLITGLLLFVPAGRIDLPYLWGYVIVISVLTIAVMICMDPELAKERKHPGPGGLDRSLRRVAAPLWVTSVIFGAADVGRLHWSDTVPRALQAAAFIVFAISMSLP